MDAVIHKTEQDINQIDESNSPTEDICSLDVLSNGAKFISSNLEKDDGHNNGIVIKKSDTICKDDVYHESRTSNEIYDLHYDDDFESSSSHPSDSISRQKHPVTESSTTNNFESPSQGIIVDKKSLDEFIEEDISEDIENDFTDHGASESSGNNNISPSQMIEHSAEGINVPTLSEIGVYENNDSYPRIDDESNIKSTYIPISDDVSESKEQKISLDKIFSIIDHTNHNESTSHFDDENNLISLSMSKSDDFTQDLMQTKNITNVNNVTNESHIISSNDYHESTGPLVASARINTVENKSADMDGANIPVNGNYFFAYIYDQCILKFYLLKRIFYVRLILPLVLMQTIIIINLCSPEILRLMIRKLFSRILVFPLIMISMRFYREMRILNFNLIWMMALHPILQKM